MTLQPHHLLHTQHMRRARVEQRCTGCGRTVQPKELYLSFTQNGAQKHCLICVTRHQAREHERKSDELSRWLTEQRR